MNRPAIIHRHIFGRLFGPFFMTVMILTAVFVMTQMLQLTDYVVNYRVGLGHVVLLLLYTMPYFLTFAIPMATMLSVLLTFLSMSADNEITALKAGGWSLYRLLAPVAVFSLLAAAVTGFMIVQGLVWGRVSVKTLLADVARKNIEIALKERTFNDQFKDVTLYVQQVDPGKKTLKHVFIEDRRTPGVTSVISAKSGRLFGDPEKGIWVLRLENGAMNQVGIENDSVYTVSFDTYDFRLDLARQMAAASGGIKDEEEMTFGELSDFIRTRKERDDIYWLAVLQYHKKFSIPAACLILGLLAVPLGVVSKTSRRSFGVMLGLLFFLLYYLILAAGEVFGEAGDYPPWIGMWMPNLVMGIVAGVLLVSTANDRPVFVVNRIQQFFHFRAEKRRKKRGEDQ